MTVYEEVVKLADTLPHDEQIRLLHHLVEKTRRLPSEEWNALFDTLKISSPLLEEPSLRREDWYDEDGR